MGDGIGAAGPHDHVRRAMNDGRHGIARHRHPEGAGVAFATLIGGGACHGGGSKDERGTGRRGARDGWAEGAIPACGGRGRVVHRCRAGHATDPVRPVLGTDDTQGISDLSQGIGDQKKQRTKQEEVERDKPA